LGSLKIPVYPFAHQLFTFGVCATKVRNWRELTELTIAKVCVNSKTNVSFTLVLSTISSNNSVWQILIVLSQGNKCSLTNTHSTCAIFCHQPDFTTGPTPETEPPKKQELTPFQGTNKLNNPTLAFFCGKTFKVFLQPSILLVVGVASVPSYLLHTLQFTPRHTSKTALVSGRSVNEYYFIKDAEIVSA
jgi:hypothetical protein